MITNERQHRITKSQVEKFREALVEFNEIELAKQGLDPKIIMAQRAALEAQLAELQDEITEYENLRSGRVTRLFPDGVSDIGEKLIEARIAKGFSQKMLAERLGMKEQQVQRYEQERYLTANLTRVAEVAEALQLNLFAYFEARTSTTSDKIAPNLKGVAEFDPAKLPLKEMKKRGWLDHLPIRPGLPHFTELDLASAFISQALQGQSPVSLQKQRVRAGSQHDPYALLAWKAQILTKARRLAGGLKPPFPAINDGAIRQIVQLSAAPDGPAVVVDLLKAYGIILVFEEHLSSTHLDGAAMLLNDSIPVIGMTLRFNRLDNFWFVLLHEIAHIMLHREQGLRDAFFDEDEENSMPEGKLEEEADEFAKSAFLSDEVWNRSFVRFTASPQQVQQFALERKVGVAIVAGRIRRERRDYRLFSDLVGQGTVRKVLIKAGYLES